MGNADQRPPYFIEPERWATFSQMEGLETTVLVATRARRAQADAVHRAAEVTALGHSLIVQAGA